MGLIYKAEDRDLKRWTALKFLPEHLIQSEEAKKRFLREARAASALDHPNICTIYEINETSDGGMFIAMAYYEGISLKEKMENTPFSLEETLQTAFQILAGLKEAHSRGILHRDIKPANIFITRKNEVKILDFGLARFSDNTKLTMTGSAMGTAAYMAPEQVRGEEGDHRIDLWAFGVLLYQLLTGGLPFTEKNPPALMYSIIHSRPVPVSMLNKTIPPDLEAIVLKCLAKDPGKRYKDASEIIQDLHLFCSRVEKGASLNPFKIIGARLERLRGTIKKILPTSAVLVLSLGILVVGKGNFFNLKKKLPRARHIVVLPFTMGKDEEDSLPRGLSLEISERLTSLEKFIPTLWVVSGDLIYNDKTFRPEEAWTHWGANLVITGNLAREADELELVVEIKDPATNALYRRKRWKGGPAELGIWQNDLILDLTHLLEFDLNRDMEEVLASGNTAIPGAFTNYIKGKGNLHLPPEPGRLEVANQFFARATTLDPGYVNAWTAKGRTAYYNFILTHDSKWIEEGEECFQKALEENQEDFNARLNLAKLYNYIGRPEEARENIEELLKYNKDNFELYSLQSILYSRMQKWAEAEKANKKMIECRPDFKLGYEYLGYFYYQTSRLTEAAEMYEKAITLAPQNLTSHITLAAIYSLLNQLDKAVRIYEKAAEVEDNGTVLLNLGQLYYYKGEFEKALAVSTRALELSSPLKLTDAEHILRINLAESCLLIPGNEKKAEKLIDETIEILEQKINTLPEKGSLFSYLSLCYAYKGFFSKADEYLKKAETINPADPEIYYRSALVFELSNRREETLKRINLYLENYGPLMYLEKDPNLKKLRNDLEYQKLINP